ncbi:BON domain-containing protein [Magnetospirillum gryphiswaldense]|nr:BON domain-containing protein [Magnetospirillum gryphiswaldense]
MRKLFVLALLPMLASFSAHAQLLDVLTAPKTLIDRAIEARSAGDIAKDNEIVVKVNAIMGKMGTVKASTEIYEQRLLITGIFDDKALYDRFEREVRQVQGVKKLYWHVSYLAKDDSRRKSLLDWGDVTVMAAKAQGRLVGTAGVADVNFRTTADAYGTVYLLGRARSGEEGKKALAQVKDGTGVRKVVDYSVVRP